MDDCIDSRPNKESLVQLATELPALLQEGGLTIRKIFSNSAKPLATLPEGSAAATILIEDKDVLYEDQKVLGIMYLPKTDEFTFSVRFGEPTGWKDHLWVDKWIKRAVLRVTASHYDPLGLASSITVQPRKFLQTLWQQQHGWDEELTSVEQTEWEGTLARLHEIRYRVGFCRPLHFEGSGARTEDHPQICPGPHMHEDQSSTLRNVYEPD